MDERKKQASGEKASERKTVLSLLFAHFPTIREPETGYPTMHCWSQHSRKKLLRPFAETASACNRWSQFSTNRGRVRPHDLAI